MEWLQTFIAGICCFAIYSFLIKENSFYRFFEHLFIGIATGYTVMIYFINFLWPEIFRPLFGLDRIAYPDGTYPEPYQWNYLLFLIPILFGSLYYCILSRKLAWLAELAIGFSLGIGSGLFIKGFFREVIPQVVDSFRPLYVPAEPNGPIDLGASLGNLLFVIILLSALTYFFFTFERREGGAIEKISATGRWMMMGCFGAFFGTTIMARMALLVERLEFLIQDWWPNLWSLFA